MSTAAVGHIRHYKTLLADFFEMGAHSFAKTPSQKSELSGMPDLLQPHSCEVKDWIIMKPFNVS